ncbi:MAG: hypothetical protein K0S45_3713 [Nitrospira sp.]|jgi:hypothetical protein|nr:hypothetical protein [Nitrospira sp.]
MATFLSIHRTHMAYSYSGDSYSSLYLKEN